MVHGVASSEFVPGKREEAVEFLKKAAGFIKKHGAAEVEVLRRWTGAPGQSARLLIMTTYDSLEAWAAGAQKLRDDTEFQAIQRRASDPEKGCIVHNTFSRTIFEVL